MSKRTFGLAAGVILAANLAFAGSPKQLTGVVYVESNIATPNGNSILAFQREDDGKLSPLPGSPFLTGGAGVVDSSFALGPFDSDQNITTNPEHTLLFAVNAGSNSIAVFHIESDGTLTAVKGSPFASQGVQPASVGYDSGYLYAVNKHQDPAQVKDQSLPNYTTFFVDCDGALSPVDGAQVEVAYGSSPSQALTHDGLLFGADFMGGLLQSFHTAGGVLQQNVPQALPSSVFAGTGAPAFPLGLAVHPSQPILYVGFVTIGKVGVYTYDVYGNLTYVADAADSGQAVCWFKTNHCGSVLYTGNAGDHSISVLNLDDPYAPKEIQHLVLNSQGGAYQFDLDASESYLFSLEQRDAGKIPQGSGNAIHTLSVDPATGKLTELAVTPLALPGDTRPQGLVAF